MIRALDQENVRAAEINLHQPTLDDVFLAKTGRKLEGSEGGRVTDDCTADLPDRAAVASCARSRQPGMWIPPLTFPLILMAVNSNGLRAATHLPGFPTESFLAFFLPFSFMQGALFASGIAGVDLARDIDTGFLNRLALTPVRDSALLLGQVGGAVGLGVAQAVLYLTVGLDRRRALRLRRAGGAFVMFVLALLIAAGFGGLGLWMALRTGSGEGVQSQFPLLFFLLFISSMNLPRNLIEVGWFRDLATAQPRQLHDRGAALARDRRVERTGARARLRRSPSP